MVDHWIIWRELAASEIESYVISRFLQALYSHPCTPAIVVIRGHLKLLNCPLSSCLSSLNQYNAAHLPRV